MGGDCMAHPHESFRHRARDLSCLSTDLQPMLYLRNRSAPAVNCWVIIHCLEVSCKEDQITSAQREWFIFVQLTDKQWIITQQFTHWTWSISILTHNKGRKRIRSLQLLPNFRHCTENSRQYLDYVAYVYISHEIISTVILLPSADLFKKGCCQLQAKVCARITG